MIAVPGGDGEAQLLLGKGQIAAEAGRQPIRLHTVDDLPAALQVLLAVEPFQGIEAGQGHILPAIGVDLAVPELGLALQLLDLLLRLRQLFLEGDHLVLELLDLLHDGDGALEPAQRLGVAALMGEEGPGHQQERRDEQDHDIDDDGLLPPGGVLRGLDRPAVAALFQFHASGPFRWVFKVSRASSRSLRSSTP